MLYAESTIRQYYCDGWPPFEH